MPITDPIADFMSVLRNAAGARKEKITVGASKMLESICSILKDEEFIEDYRVVEEGKKKFLRVHLKYRGEEPAIRHLARVSKPGLRHYVASRHIPKILGGLGVAILSTPKGLLTDKKAREQKVGGEILLKIW